MDLTYLDESALTECWSKNDPTARMRCSDAMIFADRATSSALVHFVLEPGGSVPSHTDNAEEVVLVLDGAVEACVGEDVGTLNSGGLVLIPAMHPHSIRNVGNEPARLLGFFASADVVSTFAEPLMPWDIQVFLSEGADAPGDGPGSAT